MAFTLEIVAVAPVYATGVLVQWVTTNPPDIGAYSYEVQRSGSPAGPWTSVGTVVDTFIYSDTAASLHGLTRDIYYRVIVTPPVAPPLTSAVHNIRGELPLALAGRHFLRARKMRTDLLRTFKKFSGKEYFVLKKIHWGARCTVCWDTLTKSVVDETCATCFGTGFLTGYYTPYRMWGRLDPTTTAAPLQLEGKADQRMFKFTCLDIPLLMPDDVIVGVLDDRRFIVHTQVQTEMRLVGVHQDVTLAELPRDNPVYKVPV
jgi:hypothetical protein